MDISEQIEEIIKSLGKDFKILNYVYNKKSKFIPGENWVYYSGPTWDDKEIIAAIKALLTGKWLSSGEHVYHFEINFAKKINQKYALMVNSGSSANLIMLAAIKKYLKWEDESEIIVSVVGFPTTIAPIIQNKLKPVFIDIEMESLNFDVDLIEEKITHKTKAIFVSPVLGNPPDFDRLVDLCNQYNLVLILDGCDSLGTTWNKNNLSDYAIASSFSFYAAHHITTGEGGMITTDIKELIDIARSMSWWGRDCYCVGSANLLTNGTCKHRFDKWLCNYDGIIDHKYYFTEMGYNVKPLDLQGAIGLVQISKLDEIHKNRKISRNTITDIFLNNIDGLKIPITHPLSDVSWFGTPFICKNKYEKDKLVRYLEDNKIQTRNYFAGNILLHPAYSHLDNFNNYPEANKVLDQVFFIGASPQYHNEIFDYIDNVTKEYKNKL